MLVSKLFAYLLLCISSQSYLLPPTKFYTRSTSCVRVCSHHNLGISSYLNSFKYFRWIHVFFISSSILRIILNDGLLILLTRCCRHLRLQDIGLPSQHCDLIDNYTQNKIMHWKIIYLFAIDKEYQRHFSAIE